MASWQHSPIFVHIWNSMKLVILPHVRQPQSTIWWHAGSYNQKWWLIVNASCGTNRNLRINICLSEPAHRTTHKRWNSISVYMVLQATEHMQLIEYMLRCDISNETYTRNILQFNVENTSGLVDSIFKIPSDKWLAGSIAQYLFTYEIPWK